LRLKGRPAADMRSALRKTAAAVRFRPRTENIRRICTTV